MAKLKLKKIIGNNAHWTLNKALVKQLGLTETLVLQHIIDLTESAFKRNEVFQPYEDMATELGISEYSVKQAVGKLKSHNLINVQKRMEIWLDTTLDFRIVAFKSPTTEKYLTENRYYMSDPFIYVKDNSMYMMTLLALQGYVRRIEEFVLRSSINT
jgi:biotin operon repressor